MVYTPPRPSFASLWRSGLAGGVFIISEAVKTIDGLIRKVIARYSNMLQYRPEIDTEDLLQVGRLAVLEAEKTYCPEKGAFTTWAWIYVRKAVRECLGLRWVNGQTLAMPLTDSLDAPVAEDEELTLLDSIADPDAPEGERIHLQHETEAEVQSAIDTLPDALRIVARENLLWGVPLAQIARAHEMPMHKARQAQVDAIRALRRSLLHLDDLTDWHRRKGVEAFKRSGSSVVEDLVLKREQRKSPQH